MYVVQPSTTKAAAVLSFYWLLYITNIDIGGEFPKLRSPA